MAREPDIEDGPNPDADDRAMETMWEARLRLRKMMISDEWGAYPPAVRAEIEALYAEANEALRRFAARERELTEKVEEFARRTESD